MATEPRRDRRTFLALAGGTLAAGLGGVGAAAGPQAYLACGKAPDGRYILARFDGTGSVRFIHELPGRGHGLAVHPMRPVCVAFARRPGTFADVVDYESGRLRYRIASVAGRHFLGHGTYSADGRALFTSENDFGRGRGVIGVYDAGDRYRRIGEFPSHGIGPHEIRLMPGGTVLAVANGGILTHPARGRAKLNIATMRPNLAFLDPANGGLIAAARLPDRLHKLSIRHIDVGGAGDVAVGMQYEGGRQDRVPLVGIYRAGAGFETLHLRPDLDRRLRHYVGSVSYDRSGRFFAASCPRGNLVTLWDARTGGLLRTVEAADASAVAPTARNGGFLIAGGDGRVRIAGPSEPADRPEGTGSGTIRWDNHAAVARIASTANTPPNRFR